MQVIWSYDADDDLDKVLEYIANDNIEAALKMREKLLNAAESLRQFPMKGRIGAVEGTRELIVSHRYMLVYEIMTVPDTGSKCVVIQAVVNTYQQWPPVT